MNQTIKRAEWRDHCRERTRIEEVQKCPNNATRDWGIGPQFCHSPRRTTRRCTTIELVRSSPSKFEFSWSSRRQLGSVRYSKLF